MSTKADINHIFKTINAITNKEQKGYVKPSQFNTLLQQAELDIFEENYFKTIQANKLQRGVESDFQRTDALVPYLRHVTGSATGYVLPSNYMHVVAVFSGTTEVKFVRHSELGKILGSTIVAPSSSSPIYTIAPTANSESTPTTKINFYTAPGGPNSMSYKVVYLARPTVPVNGHYVVQANTGLFDISTSTALDAPKSEHTKIMHKVLQYLGIHLKEGDILNYATTELMNE
tara:strand:+ start:486 stop:1178 length:693 start_codon:yes stop_codon:yes gene_type:complete